MKKNTRDSLLYIPEQTLPDFFQKDLYVSFEKDWTPLKEKLSPDHLQTLFQLYETPQKKLKEAIQTLLTFKDLYPHCPEIYNLLSFFYIRKKKLKKLALITKENYRNNPNNLLAKINYGDFLLRKGKASAVDELFQHQYDLRNLYPNKKVFHVTEYRGFMVLMGFLMHAKKRLDQAKYFHYLALKVDKNSSQVKVLTKTLYHQPLYKKIYEIIRKKIK